MYFGTKYTKTLTPIVLFSGSAIGSYKTMKSTLQYILQCNVFLKKDSANCKNMKPRMFTNLFPQQKFSQLPYMAENCLQSVCSEILSWNRNNSGRLNIAISKTNEAIYLRCLEHYH